MDQRRFSPSELGEREKCGYVGRVSASDDDQKPPSLRIRELTITNFRTFVEPTTISFCDANGNADAIAVFHGDNGSGKSNALAALDLFFQTAHLLLRSKSPEGDELIPWNMDYSVSGVHGDRPIHLKHQDRPSNRNGPMEIDVHFNDSRFGRLKATFTPSGNQVRLRLLWRKTSETEFATVSIAERDQLLTWIRLPRGLYSQPLTNIDSRRRQKQFMDDAEQSLMPASLSNYLFALSTSRVPKDRNRWRFFLRVVAQFSSFKGKHITVEIRPNKDPDDETVTVELVVENPGETVLALDELSSGEQHVIVLLAASLLARSAILAIEEPEISLDAKNQELLNKILGELSEKGLIDQIILESHVARFDGPNVIRFTRNDDGSTSVKREASLDESKREVERLAKEKGAEHLWVTRDGYTKLPEKMVQDLGAGSGGHVWFLKGPEHWEAWPEGHVDDLFRGGEGNGN